MGGSESPGLLDSSLEYASGACVPALLWNEVGMSITDWEKHPVSLPCLGFREAVNEEKCAGCFPSVTGRGGRGGGLRWVPLAGEAQVQDEEQVLQCQAMGVCLRVFSCYSG